jgi:hypothetical protein
MNVLKIINLEISHACHVTYVYFFSLVITHIYFRMGEDKINLFLKNFSFTFLWPYLNECPWGVWMQNLVCCKQSIVQHHQISPSSRKQSGVVREDATVEHG